MTFGETVGSLRRTLHRALVRRIALRSDRPFPHLLAMRAIKRAEVRSQAELAERLLIDAPATSRLVVRLESEGLLRRKEGSDRRSVRLQTTSAAAKEVAAIDEGLAWLDREVRRHLTPREFETAIALMWKVQQGVCAEQTKKSG
jgi:MarR family transcriptional regulator for hemolysin